MDVRAILGAHLAGWRAAAACRDEPEDLFLSGKQLPRRGAGSPTVALALAICARCPVRGACLREGLTPLKFTIEHYREDLSDNPMYAETGFVRTLHRIVSSGVWGGSTEIDRLAVAHLPARGVALRSATRNGAL